MKQPETVDEVWDQFLDTLLKPEKTDEEIEDEMEDYISWLDPGTAWEDREAWGIEW